MGKEHEHFKTQYPHTEIKHKLLSNTLNAAIGIANAYAIRNSAFKNYVFIDLFAGQGMFEDGTEGSPVIALNTMVNYLKNEKNKNFDKLLIIPIEKDSDNQKKLIENINSIIEQEGVSKQIGILTGQDDWSNYSQDIKQQLATYQSGFIFVDPFSTELKISELNSLMKQARFHDTLILININGLERILGLDDDDSLNKVCGYFDVDLVTLRNLKNTYTEPAAIIRNLINLSLKDKGKDFVINVAISRTNRGKLENSDRFYLCLLTNSIGVADTFLKTYAELLGVKEIVTSGGQGNLFAGMTGVTHFSLSSKIIDIMPKNTTISLFDIVSKLYDDFYSWKEASSTEIPTLKDNVYKSVNHLLETKKIQLISTDFKNKKCKNYDQLTKEAFNNKVNLEKVTMQKPTSLS